MRIVLNIIGLVLALFGIVWILQGLSQNRWAIVGAGVLLAAVVVLTSANRRRA